MSVMFEKIAMKAAVVEPIDLQISEGLGAKSENGICTLVRWIFLEA